MELTWELFCGDSREVIATWPENSVQCAVTSPPYWRLRDYGTAQWVGGDPACPHRKKATGATNNKGNAGGLGTPFTDECGLCGAQRVDQQVGLEETPDDYVAALVAVFREVRRVLRDDGTLWLNIGDMYAGGGTADDNTPSRLARLERMGGARSVMDGKFLFSKRLAEMTETNARADRTIANTPDLKVKDLVGLPWLVAFALRADGWYLRSDVIWAKKSCMPESVTDRPTKAHEYVFMLTKSARYYYDAAVIASATGGNARSVWPLSPEQSPYDHFAVMPKALARKCILVSSPPGALVMDPFAGMATTGVTALEEGRSFRGVELSPKYHAQARERLERAMPLFAQEVRTPVVSLEEMQSLLPGLDETPEDAELNDL